MKRPTLSRSSKSGETDAETDADRQIQEAVVEAITESNDKTVEIRPANESSGRRKALLALVVGGALAISYWLRRSERPTDKLRDTVSGAAEQTEKATEQAAETIQESGEQVGERVEEESQQVGEQVQQTGETAAEKTQQAGETAADTADESAGGSSGSYSSD